MDFRWQEPVYVKSKDEYGVVTGFYNDMPIISINIGSSEEVSFVAEDVSDIMPDKDDLELVEEGELEEVEV